MSFQLHLIFLKIRNKVFFSIRTGDTLRTGKTSEIQKPYSFLVVIISSHHPLQFPNLRESLNLMTFLSLAREVKLPESLSHLVS